MTSPLGELFLEVMPDLSGVADKMAEAGAQGAQQFNASFAAQMKDAGGIGNQAATAFMGGFESVVNGRMPDVLGAFDVLEDAAKKIGSLPFEAAGKAIDLTVGNIPVVGDIVKGAMDDIKGAFGAVFGVFDEFKVMGGQFVGTLLEISDAYAGAARKIAAATSDMGDVVTFGDALRNIMTTGEVADFDKAADAIGRLASNVKGLLPRDVLGNADTSKLEELTKVFVAAEEVVGRIDPTKFAGILNAFDVADKPVETLTHLVNIARDSGINFNVMTDAMTRSGPAMRDMGYSAEQTGQFFAEMTKEGEKGTRLIQGMAQLDKHLNDMVASGNFKTVQDAWAAVVTSVQRYVKAGDDVGARKLLDQLMPAGTASLMLDNIKRGILALPAAMQQLQGMDAPITDAEEKTRGLAEQMRALSGQFRAALEPVGQHFSDVLGMMGHHIGTWLHDNQAKIQAWAEEVNRIFIGAMVKVTQFLGDTIDAFGDILGGFKDAVVAITGATLGAVGVVSQLLSHLPGKYGKPFQDIVDMIKPLGQPGGPLEKAFDFDVGKSLDKVNAKLQQWTNEFGPLLAGATMPGGPGLENYGKKPLTLQPKDKDGNDVKDSGDLVKPGDVDINLKPQLPSGVVMGPSGIPLPAYLAPGAPGVPGAPPTASTPSTGLGGLNWDALAAAEASGNWANKTNPKYFGGLQFDQPTWDQFKPAGAPSNPADATKEQQIQAAQNALASGRTASSLWPQNWRLLYSGGAGGTPPQPGQAPPQAPPPPPPPQPVPPQPPLPPPPTPPWLPPPFAGTQGTPTPTLPGLLLPGVPQPSLPWPYSGYGAPKPSAVITQQAGDEGPPTPVLPPTATGGTAADAAEAFARSVSGRPYETLPQGTGAGQHGLYDCSGFMGALYGILTGKQLPTTTRFFTTLSDFKSLGFIPTDKPMPGTFQIGVNPAHMAGTLPSGVNVESGGPSGGGTQYGGSAEGAWAPQFTQHYYLPTASMTGSGTFALPPQATGNVPATALDAGYGPGLGPSGPGGGMYPWGRMRPEDLTKVLDWQNRQLKTSQDLTQAQSDAADKTRIFNDLNTTYQDQLKAYQHQVDMQGTALAQTTKEFHDLTETEGKLNSAHKDMIDADQRYTDLQRQAAIEAIQGPPKLGAVKPDKDAETLGAGLVKGIFQELGFPDVFGKIFTQWGIWKLGMGALGFGLSRFFDKEGNPVFDTSRFGGAAIAGGAGALNLNLPKNIAAPTGTGDRGNRQVGPGPGPGGHWRGNADGSQTAIDANGNATGGYIPGPGPLSANLSTPNVATSAYVAGDGQHSGQLADFVMGMLPPEVSHPLRRPSSPSDIAGNMRSSRPADKQTFGGLTGPPVVFNNNLTGVMGQREVDATINKGIQAGSRLNSIAGPMMRMV